MDIVTEKPRGRFDVVCANLYGHLLVEAAPALRSLASRFVILSGIREMETDLVADAFLALKTRELVRDGDGQWSGLLLEVGC
jgi:ribosomal protein L11 methylase PrmA